jgi:hypothetical protein
LLAIPGAETAIEVLVRGLSNIKSAHIPIPHIPIPHIPIHVLTKAGQKAMKVTTGVGTTVQTIQNMIHPSNQTITIKAILQCDHMKNLCMAANSKP